MSNRSTILHKRSTTPGAVPALTSLSAGELAISVADGKLFVKTSGNAIESFSNDSYSAFILDTSLSGVEPQFGNNSISQSFANVLGGIDNDVSGAGSSIVNGSDNNIQADYAFIGNGSNNNITSIGDYGAILGGQNNTVDHNNSFILGSNITSHAADFTYVNNISAQGVLYGNGSGLTNLAAAVAPDTDVRALTANWQSTYTTVQSESASWINVTPAFNGDISTTTINDVISATVVAIQGEPISTQYPANGQVLQWSGTAWTPGTIPPGGSGGGGLVYYLNYANEAQTPTTNLSATPNTPKELGLTGTTALTSYTLTDVSITDYDLICGFVSLTASPQTTVIPAGLWDFNIWASATSTVTNQMSLKLDVYKYDGSNVPTLLASSGDIYMYDPVATAQYIASVVFPQTTLLATDRIYIELRAKGTQNNKNVTIYFGGTSPTHVHTTFPSVGGTGLVKVIDGVYQNPASLLVNTDVAANAEIDQSKINGLTDVASKANTTYTTVQTASGNWVTSNITGIANTTKISNMMQITQAGYNAITPAVNTLYIIVG